MMFIGYSQANSANCYKMFNPNMSRVTLTRDIIWLGCMYYPRLNTKVTHQTPIISVPVTLFMVRTQKQMGLTLKSSRMGLQSPKKRRVLL